MILNFDSFFLFFTNATIYCQQKKIILHSVDIYRIIEDCHLEVSIMVYNRKKKLDRIWDHYLHRFSSLLNLIGRS
jgi:hypothetical protein